MKKLFTLILCFSVFFSCDDGDLDIPAFDFTDTVFNCELKSGNYTLFRLGIAEAIVVTLSDDVLKNEVTTEPIEVGITESNVIYRTFDDQISSTYFCEDIPPTTPTITSNWTGVSGASNLIIIETIEEFDSQNILIGYRHQITFQNLKVENGNKFLAFEEGVFGDFITEL